jgi:hypothetical protein
MVKFVFDDSAECHMIDFSDGDMIVMMQASAVTDLSTFGTDLIESILR